MYTFKIIIENKDYIFVTNHTNEEVYNILNNSIFPIYKNENNEKCINIPGVINELLKHEILQIKINDCYELNI